MKKKVLYGVSMAFLACAAMGPLQSCKDDLSDLTHQVNHDKSQLAASLKALSDVVAANKQDCAEKRAELEKRLQDQLDPLNALNLPTEFPKLKDEVDRLNGLTADFVTYEKLQEELEALKGELGGMSDDQIKEEISQQIADKMAGITETLNNLSETLTNVSGDVDNLKAWQTAINDWKESLKDIDFSQIDKNKNEIAAIKLDMEIKQAAIDEINQNLRNLSGNLNLLEAQVLGHTEEIEGLRLEIEELVSDFESLNAQIEEVYGAIEETNIFVSQAIRMLQNEIDEAFDTLTNRVDNLITGIVLQGTDCPVFGNFSLPLGIKSNLLFNWYGYNDRSEFKFPNASSMYNYYDANPVLTEAELAALAPEYKNVAEGLLGDVNVGRLYMTINPAGHYFDSSKFSLETSAGKKFPATLDVSKSGHELYFGYTRGLVEGNGFYRADVVIPEDEIVNARLDIDEGLKAAAKDALKDPSKRSAYELLKAVYAQLNGKFPAYGVRYDWGVGEKNYSVLSGYDVAATTAKPLSYSFLYGKGTNKHLPTFDHLNNIFENLIDKDKIKIEIPKNFEVDGFTFEFNGMDITLSASPDIEYNETITVTVPGFWAYGDNGIKVWVKDIDVVITPDKLTGLVDAIKGGFEGAIDDMNEQLKGQLNEQIREQIVNKLVDQVNEMLVNIENSVNEMLGNLEDEINGQIGDMLDDILGSIENKTGTLFNKVNDVIDIYNKVARKINHVLKDPNHYLQVAMFYKGNGTGKVGVLSNNKMHPTKFTPAGGNAIGLYASSYSAEILAPAYLKYIAVSNVYDKNGNEVAAEKANLAEINKASGLNKVFAGSTKRVAVAASKLKKDLVYEIVYQGVDYSGRTSAQKFYITVNK